jgi:hypothetical protein
MNQFVRFLTPVLIIAIGIFLKYSKIPNSENIRKFWWVFVMIGFLNLTFKVILYLF